MVQTLKIGNDAIIYIGVNIGNLVLETGKNGSEHIMPVLTRVTGILAQQKLFFSEQDNEPLGQRSLTPLDVEHFTF